MLTNLHVLDLPESEKHNLGIMSVCEHDNSKTIRATGMKFDKNYFLECTYYYLKIVRRHVSIKRINGRCICKDLSFVGRQRKFIMGNDFVTSFFPSGLERSLCSWCHVTPPLGHQREADSCPQTLSLGRNQIRKKTAAQWDCTEDNELRFSPEIGNKCSLYGNF
ncbi:hypothetical protein AVEN_20775-1 [Araneus ventricosus]|uniref:Uncharacterized protein n=1 Tax=Araneus ventricosus TaxID=182803 RepID=A0A4Y2KM48_ARAVE|nr:hypothetical protein AVEN_20775-1 [Araneus ventricosus]